MTNDIHFYRLQLYDKESGEHKRFKDARTVEKFERFIKDYLGSSGDSQVCYQCYSCSTPHFDGNRRLYFYIICRSSK